MDKLRVGLIAPLSISVPPSAYGGTEAVIDALARGLAAAGHEVILFASGDSTCPVRLRSNHPRALGMEARPGAEDAHVEAAYRQLAGEVDVIHDHTLAGPRRLARSPSSIPVVVTAHGPFTSESRAIYRAAADQIALIAISDAHAASAVDLPVTSVIHHGVELDRFPLGAGDGGYVAFLGRMSADKGPHRAIRAARMARTPIRLAAKMWERDERRFYDQHVAPLLGRDAVYLGELGSSDKLAFLAGATVLLNPITWPEPFGLNMIEALACGTPVVSFAAGSAPEIIRHGIDGYFCADESAMAAAIPLAAHLDRDGCRAGVETRFSSQRMVSDYLTVYRAAIASARPVMHPWPARVAASGAGARRFAHPTSTAAARPRPPARG